MHVSGDNKIIRTITMVPGDFAKVCTSDVGSKRTVEYFKQRLDKELQAQRVSIKNVAPGRMLFGQIQVALQKTYDWWSIFILARGFRVSESSFTGAILVWEPCDNMRGIAPLVRVSCAEIV